MRCNRSSCDRPTAMRYDRPIAMRYGRPPAMRYGRPTAMSMVGLLPWVW